MKNILKKNLQSGLVFTCLGGPNTKLSYKKSRLGNSSLDRLFIYYANKNHFSIRDFSPESGSDERQYCSSENNLPVGQIARTFPGQFYQYHTSGDNKKFMKINQVIKSVNALEKILKINDNIFPLKRFMPYCELQLGKRDLYPNINSSKTVNNSSDLFKARKLKLDGIFTDDPHLITSSVSS